MSDCFIIAMFAANVVQTPGGVWLAHNSPWRGSRTVAALMTTGCFAVGGSSIGFALSSLSGPWSGSVGFSCGETRIVELPAIFAVVALIRAVWRSINSDSNPVARAAMLATAYVGLVFTGFHLVEAVQAHDKFHQVQLQLETPQ